MLRELHIQNLAVIEDVTIELGEGLNVFTGETGAGKSLIIGAFELLLGLRTASGMLRKGSDEGRVSGVFELSDASVRAQVAELLDTTLESGDPLLVTRKLFASGRSSVSVNGQPVTTGMLKEVGRHLVDIHGQHDHQYLLKSQHQLLVIDGYAGCEALRQSLGQAYQRLRELREQQKQLSASAALRKQQLELYRFQAEEIDAVEPVDGEMVELQARHSLLSNMRKLKADAGHAYGALYESDGSILERLQALTHVLVDLAVLDETGVGPIAEQVRAATLSLQDQAYDLSRYVDRLELDRHELEEVEDRLNQLNRLASKYGDGSRGGDSLASVLAYRQQIQVELERLEAADQDLSGLEQSLTQAGLQLRQLGEQLTERRLKAAKAIGPQIETQLHELGMPEAKFSVELTQSGFEDAGPTGFDRISMLVQPNPGQGFAPLREIASGGELSRVMLALKSVLAAGDRISVLVFDEIDSNIGGRLGHIIGEKLRGLTRQANTSEAKDTSAAIHNEHQVLCITHLPQIAAFGDKHLKIQKQVTGKQDEKQTTTVVTPLVGDSRVKELAEMMAGQKATQTTMRQAKELLQAALV